MSSAFFPSYSRPLFHLPYNFCRRIWLWDFSSALFLLLWETEWIASNFCHSVPHTAQHTAFKKESCPFVSGFLASREIKATLCFKSNEQAMEAIWGKDIWKEKDWGSGGFGFVSFYEILKICSLTEGSACVYLLGGFWGAVFCSGETPQWVGVMCDCAWLSRGPCDPSGDTAKDQRVAMPLNRQWDCSDHQGSGPFPAAWIPRVHVNLKGDSLNNDKNWTNPAKPGHFDLGKKKQNKTVYDLGAEKGPVILVLS